MTEKNADSYSGPRIAILQTISQIPKGRLSSYGDIAKAAGYPTHARFVGSVLKKLPEDTAIPWFRVINSQGKISFPEQSEAHRIQRMHLLEEGHPLTLSLSYFRSVRWPEDKM